MKHFVYLLIPRSGKEWYYCGYTDNPDRRLKKHNAGLVKSTKLYKPFKMIIVDKFKTKEEAMARERQLKKRSSEKKKLVNNYFNNKK